MLFSTAHEELPPALIQAELARILASASFRHALQLQRLLKYMVDAVLAQQEERRLREFSLALDCFQRNPGSYDPRKDPIVRVSAGRLRQKLHHYYRNEGKEAYLEITLPVGSYTPLFVERAAKGSSSYRRAATVRLSAPVKRGSSNLAARDLHDRGRFALQQQGVDGCRKAVALFEQAVAADPRFASAYSGLALAHLGLVARAAASAANHVNAAKAAVQRALELDPESSEACASLAVITFRYEFDWKAAEPLYRTAIRFAPWSRYAHHAYGFALMVNGRFGEADTHYRTARDLDPVDYTLRCQHALISIYTARYEDAETELLAVIDVDGANLLARALLAASYLYSGRPRQALQEYEWVAQAAPNLSIGLCGKAQAFALLGERDASLRLLQEMLDRYGERFVSPYQIAMVHARLGNDAAALQWLDRAGRERDANFVCAPVDPTFERLRPLRSWHKLLATHGLMPRERMTRGGAGSKRARAQRTGTEGA